MYIYIYILICICSFRKNSRRFRVLILKRLPTVENGSTMAWYHARNNRISVEPIFVWFWHVNSLNRVYIYYKMGDEPMAPMPEVVKFQ